MKGTAKVVKGHIEEAAGALASSNKLRVKGQMDQVMGRITQASEKGVLKVKEAVRTFLD